MISCQLAQYPFDMAPPMVSCHLLICAGPAHTRIMIYEVKPARSISAVR
jgi:hypothetical protein